MTYTRDEIIGAVADVVMDGHAKQKAGRVTEEETLQRNIALIGLASRLNISVSELQREVDSRQEQLVREVIAG